jgi:putative tricarboxylic transport membrane protein
MLEAAIEGLSAALQLKALGYLFLGIALGIYFGAVPGLSGLTGMAILLPFTFGMEPVPAFSFLLGMYAVTTTSDSIPAILIGVPGTAAAQATVLDGFPLAQRGEAGRAFGAAFTCSAIGGVIGGIFMGLSIPIVQPIVLSFAKPELFMLGLLGLTMIGALSGGSILKGLVGAGLGLLVSQIGYAEQMAVPRYWFGFTYLLDGLPMVPAVLGLFSVPELVSMAARQRSISSIPKQQATGTLMDGVRDSFRHWWLLLRSSLIGIYIGVLPALGSTIADWVAYGHAVQSAKDKSQFGKGDIRGVIAPEAANNAVKGGDLVPTFAFGIPGSAAMAILLGAFLIQGLTPGPEMLSTKLSITFSMMWSLILANIIAALLLMAWANQLQRIIFIPAHLVLPGITFFVLIGAWTASSDIGDWVTLIVFGILGVIMKRAGWPRAPLVLGLILGRIMESSLHLSMSAYGLEFLTRPIVLVIGAFILLSLVMAVRSQIKEGKDPKGPPQASDADQGDPRLSFWLSAFLCTVLATAVLMALPWPDKVRLFPLAFGLPALALCLAALVWDGVAVREAWRRHVTHREVLAAPDGEIRRSVHFFGWLVGVVLMTMLAGQHVALPLFMLAYLRVWGGYGWLLSITYAACGLAFQIALFDWMSPTTWYPAILPRLIWG